MPRICIEVSEEALKLLQRAARDSGLSVDKLLSILVEAATRIVTNELKLCSEETGAAG